MYYMLYVLYCVLLHFLYYICVTADADTGKKMNPVSRFYLIFPDFFTTFPWFFTNSKFFKVRKCERCGSLNPRLTLLYKPNYLTVRAALKSVAFFSVMKVHFNVWFSILNTVRVENFIFFLIFLDCQKCSVRRLRKFR